MRRREGWREGENREREVREREPLLRAIYI